VSNLKCATLATKGIQSGRLQIAMGCFASKDKLSKEDLDFLKSHTRYDEATIKEWYKGFKVYYTTHASKFYRAYVAKSIFV